MGTGILQDDSRGLCKEKVISCFLRAEKKKWVGEWDRLPCCKVFWYCLDYRKYGTAAWKVMRQCLFYSLFMLFFATVGIQWRLSLGFSRSSRCGTLLVHRSAKACTLCFVQSLASRKALQRLIVRCSCYSRLPSSFILRIIDMLRAVQKYGDILSCILMALQVLWGTSMFPSNRTNLL